MRHKERITYTRAPHTRIRSSDRYAAGSPIHTHTHTLGRGEIKRERERETICNISIVCEKKNLWPGGGGGGTHTHDLVRSLDAARVLLLLYITRCVLSTITHTHTQQMTTFPRNDSTDSPPPRSLSLTPRRRDPLSRSTPAAIVRIIIYFTDLTDRSPAPRLLFFFRRPTVSSNHHHLPRHLFFVFCTDRIRFYIFSSYIIIIIISICTASRRRRPVVCL